MEHKPRVATLCYIMMHYCQVVGSLCLNIGNLMWGGLGRHHGHITQCMAMTLLTVVIFILSDNLSVSTHWGQVLLIDLAHRYQFHSCARANPLVGEGNRCTVQIHSDWCGWRYQKYKSQMCLTSWVGQYKIFILLNHPPADYKSHCREPQIVAIWFSATRGLHCYIAYKL